jgi:hypothetical protein
VTILWPRVKTALVTALPTVLPDANVYDGPVVTGEKPIRYVTVGWQPSTDDVSAGSFEQSTAPDGFSAQEDGTVLLEVAAVTGATDVPDAFDLAEAISLWVQNNQTLGVLSANATADVSAEVLEAQTRAGAAQRLLLTVGYTTLV